MKTPTMKIWGIPHIHILIGTFLIACYLILPVARAKAAPNLQNSKGTHQGNISDSAHRGSNSSCEPLLLPACKTLNLYHYVKLPNSLGHSSQHEVSRALKKFAPMLRTAGCGEWLSSLLCLTYAPPCPKELLKTKTRSEVTAPACRQLCASAWAGCWGIMEKAGMHWPHALDCETMPIGVEEDGKECVVKKGKVVNHTHVSTELTTRAPTVTTPVPTKAKPTASKAKPNKKTTPAKKAQPSKPPVTKKPPSSKNSKKITQKNTTSAAKSTTKPKPEVNKARPAVKGVAAQNRTHAQSNNRTTVHTQQKCSPKIKRRRYDITELGDNFLFRGWADVQGQGAANDYCRVIGRSPKHRFLSCALAGGNGHDHMYVSKRGFDVGHAGSWFMRDMDKDGRDDYCRCVGRGKTSKLACMKAGKTGFYGSLTQPGNQYTFYVKSRLSCDGRTIHPLLGLTIAG